MVHYLGNAFRKKRKTFAVPDTWSPLKTNSNLNRAIKETSLRKRKRGLNPIYEAMKSNRRQETNDLLWR